MGGIIILGAGIIGCSTAYYLSKSEQTDSRDIHLVEAADEFFQNASGLAGGFLARDWFSPAVSELGALSFKLHKQLADENTGGQAWGYSRSTALSLRQSKDLTSRSGADWLRDGSSRATAAIASETSHGNIPKWITRTKEHDIEVICSAESVAQVDPLRLSKFLLQEVRNAGVQVYQPAKPLSISRDDLGNLTKVRLSHKDGHEEDVHCKQLVICAGAWTPRVFSTLFPESKIDIPIEPMAGHSILIHSPHWSKAHEDGGCHAIFATEANGHSPEIFSRMNSEIYVAGINDTKIPLPEVAGDVQTDAEAIKNLQNIAARILQIPERPDDLTLLRQSVCFRPVTRRGPPLVCRIPDFLINYPNTHTPEEETGVFIAAGHGPWGISQSLGTGYVMTELIQGRKTSADVHKLSL